MSHDFKDSKDKDSIIDKFIETKEKLAELEKRHEKYRKMVEEIMLRDDTNVISHNLGGEKYQIKKTLSARQSISKSDLPSEIWERYAKTSTFNIIRVDKVKDKSKDKDEIKGKGKLFKRDD